MPLDKEVPEPADGVSSSTPRREVKPGTGGRMARVALLFVVVLGGGFFWVHFQKSEANVKLASLAHEAEAAPPTLDVIKVNLAAGAETLTLPGEAAAWNETTIYARVNGYVSKYRVDIGDHVAAGQSLAEIDTPELDAELAAAKAKLSVAIAEVAVKQARAGFAETTEQRWRDSPKGVVSDQEREAKSAGKSEADAELAAAKAQVALQQAEVDRLSILTQFKDVKAPFEGTIVQRHIDVGDLVTAGSTANTTSLYRISNDNPIRVFVHAPQSVAVQLIDIKTSVEILGAGAAALHLDGNVTRSAKAIDPSSRTMRVEIDVANSGSLLVPGMYVQVKFHLKDAPAFSVPAAAMLFRSTGPQVAVVNDNGTVVFRNVTIVSDDGATVSLASGLKDGDKVAVNLSSQIVAGTVVKTREIGETLAAATAPTALK